MKSFILLLLTTVFFLSCCASSKNSSPEKTTPAYETLAGQKYKSTVQYLFNAGRNYVLCVHRDRPAAAKAGGTLAFFVYDLKKERLIFEDSLTDGHVNWIDEHQIQVTNIPGIVRVDEFPKETRGYVFDVTTGKKKPAGNADRK